MIKRFLAVALIVEAFQVSADEIITADTIVVSANRDRQSIIDANESISVVSQDEVLLQGADTVADALQDAPSVLLVNDGTPGLKRVSIRGESAYRTLVMIDGQRITDQKTKSGAPLLINPFFIDQIEVVRLAVVGLILQPYGAGFDGDPAFPFQVHVVQKLAFHIAFFHGARQFQEPVGKRGLPVVDMGNDGEISDVFLIHVGELLSVKIRIMFV